ncbi:MmpS family transport accessory protein [Mycobacteroides salmoniphilum]|uniref:Putative membrane protein mmpS4 n=1 Tax=Mycobacteroides salmoniphilum TaxID=404941 RepID=A0A4R8SSH6_9MYCO|nr:MmpS family transport accessory protein [Mycobacteroides salmoniphilum]TEA03314.1 putative membrane protein mmpS4 [Mycobacteroides salmoniphilum]
MVLVLAIAGFAVWRIRGIFGSHQLPTYYEIYGPPGTIADINYIDKEGEPHQINGATLPWSIEIVTTAPSMTGNILAQTRNADQLGCRITANGEIKDERYTNEVSAYVYCFVKSA